MPALSRRASGFPLPLRQPRPLRKNREGIAMYTAGGAVTDDSSVYKDFWHLFWDTYPTALLYPYER